MPQTTTTFIDDLLGAAILPVWILGCISVAVIGIYGVVRCFQLERKASGIGFIALVVAWLAAQPFYPIAIFMAVYCEANCDNTLLSIFYLGYAGLAAIICFSILRYVNNAK